MSNSKKQNRPILIIDGLNLFIRHYLVNQTINDKSEPIGGVVGFIKSIDYLVRTFVPSKLFVVWETGGGSARRRHIYKEYKSNRSKLKEIKKIQQGKFSLRDQLAVDETCKIQQIATLSKLLKTTPVCQIFISGTECDDVVAYVATQHFRVDPTEKIIVSSDKDFYQLLENDTVKIYDIGKREIVTGKTIQDRYGIAPRNFCLARSVVGDVSDNLDGVPGVGLKTAVKRFTELADAQKDVTIEEIMKECDLKISQKAKQKIYKDVRNSEELIRRNWKLMYLTSGTLSASEIAKIEFTISNHKPKMNKISLIKEVLLAGISVEFDFDTFAAQMRNYMTVSE